MTKRILVMAGGTGGHVFPGLAVADELSRHNWQVLWLGTKDRIEAKLVPKAGYKIEFIDVVGVRKNGILTLLAAPFKIIKSICQARTVLKAFKPDVVIGLGGFASGPGGVAAWMQGIPLIVHEQNAVPGLTNKCLAKLAKAVFTGFEGAFHASSKANGKFQWVGNPVRAAFTQLPSKQQVGQPLRLLVVGGSLGARALNQVVPTALDGLANIQVRHQTGAGHLTSVENAYQDCQSLDQTPSLMEFIDDMPSAYEWADLVICRAGALTVSEVSAAGVPAIFVPLPHAVDDHQTKNAQALVDLGGAFMLPESQMTTETLQTLLGDCIGAPEKLIEMGNKAKTLARLNAAQDVAHFCIALSEQTK